MNTDRRNFDSTPVSEGMRHGPIAPPDLDDHPLSASWIMDEVAGDGEAYQLRMLQESLMEDKALQQIDPEIYQANWDRLERALASKFIAKPVIEDLVTRQPALGLHRLKRLGRHRE